MHNDPCKAAKQYINDIRSGTIRSCKPVQNAVNRHLRDLNTGESRGIFFDETAAARAIGFFSFLQHSKGKWAGQPFVLSPWQAFIVYVLFGWKRIDGTRRFRYSYVEVPRKSGKTTLAAGVALYMLIADGEAGAEVYTGATTREQAKICFEEAQRMVRKSPAMNKRAMVLAHNINVQATASKMEAVSSDYNTLDGLNPHCVVLDELHAYKDRGLFDIFDSATGARSQALIFSITTAGFNKEWFCYKYRRDILAVLDGVVEDDSTFGIVYTLDDDDDMADPDVWIKANPNYGVSIYESYLKDKVHQATIRPSEQVNVKTKNFNIWTNASQVWITDDAFQIGSHGADELELASQPCYGGIDLASTSDFTALALLFPDGNGDFDLLLRFWIPQNSVARRMREGLADLERWIAAGFVTVTPGNTTDYERIKADILECAAQFDLQSIAYDSWNSSHLVQELDDELGTVERVDEDGKYVEMSRLSKFGQGFRSMSTPTKELEKYMLDGRIRHGGNPVLRWMFRNVEIKLDPAGNMKPDKAKSSEKIDGVVATIMALGEYLTFGVASDDGPSQYEDQPIFVF